MMALECNCRFVLDRSLYTPLLAEDSDLVENGMAKLVGRFFDGVHYMALLSH